MIDLDVIKKARAGTTVLEVIGLLLGVFRFWFRYRIRRLWWEDAWAFAAFLFATIYLTGTWLDILYWRPTATVGFWMYVFSFNSVIWCVRHSTLFSVARIIYPSLTLRRMVLGIGSVFFLLYISFIAAKLWYYCHDLSWMNNTLYFGNPLLPLGTNLIIFEITTPMECQTSNPTATDDPTYFASGVMVTLAAICRAVCQLLSLNSIVSLVMDAEVAFSSIMCNLLVFVTSLYRYGRSASPLPSTESDDDDDDYTTPVRPPQNTQLLTTVEVGGSDYFSEGMTSSSKDRCSSQLITGLSGTCDSLEQQSEKTSSHHISTTAS